MKNTTLCYIEKDDCYLMLLRNKKENDLNEGKWIGVGGKFEPGETAEDCLIRETLEETGLKLTSYCLRGIVRFISPRWGNEDMYLYTADAWENDLLPDCSEGTLKWIKKSDVLSLNLWEGDPYFLKELLDNKKDIRMSLIYDDADVLQHVYPYLSEV